MHNVPQNYAEERTKQSSTTPAGSALGQLARTKQAIHNIDAANDPVYAGAPIVRLAKARTLLTLPLLRDNEVVVAFGIYRQEVRPFTDKQIALVQNFSAPAV